MKVDAIFTGDKEVEAFLKEIPNRLNVRFTTAAGVRALKKYTVKDAQRRIKMLGLYKTGTLYRSIKAWTWKKGAIAGAQKRIRSKRSPGKYTKRIKDDAYYSYWIEHGHKDRGGNFVPAKPFWRPAWEATKDKVVHEMNTEFWELIKRHARRHGWM